MFGLFKKKKSHNDVIKAAEKAPAPKSYIDMVNAAEKEIIANSNITLDDERSPITLKRGEAYLFSVPATLGTYKSNGKVGYSGVTVSIPIMKGVRYRVGSGRMGVQKSWVFDNPGVLHVTTTRVVFDGSTKNSSAPMSKIIEMQIDEANRCLLIGRESGPDWAFKMNEFPPADKMAAALAFAEGRVNNFKKA